MASKPKDEYNIKRKIQRIRTKAKKQALSSSVTYERSQKRAQEIKKLKNKLSGSNES